MSLHTIPRNVIHRLQTQRPIQRLAHHSGASNSPSEMAIRSIPGEHRSTFRW